MQEALASSCGPKFDVTHIFCRPGLANRKQLFALQIAASIALYGFFDRLKVWEKYKATLLNPDWSVGANLLMMAAGEYIAMLCFSIWLFFVTSHGVSYISLLVYIYVSLQVTKATAEAIAKHSQVELGLWAGSVIAVACHGTVIYAVTVIIPMAPFLLMEIGLLLQLWAYAGVFYSVVKNF